jgi:uncharacterized protein YjiS (DUF1127 family)
VTSLCLAVKCRLAKFLEARKHYTGASTMALQTTLSPARVVARPPRHRGTQLLQRETALRQAISLLRRWRERMRMRRQARNLCELDDHVLQDIGLTRAELLWEAAKPSARPPSSRRKAATAFDTADLRTFAIAWQSSLASSGKGGGNVRIECCRSGGRTLMGKDSRSKKREGEASCST